MRDKGVKCKNLRLFQDGKRFLDIGFNSGYRCESVM